MEDNIFDIAFTLDGEKYKGWVNPSEKKDGDGKPVSFHVVLNEVSFGYLSFMDCKWTMNEPRPKKLIEITGREIERHFAL